MAAPCLKDIDVVVLAGGLGTRIRDTLGDTPKLLAPVGGTPFLDLLIRRLKSCQARRLVLGLGHLADRVAAHLDANPPDAIEVVTAVEPEPLGTAGALRFVRTHIRTDPVMVMNGDSFFADVRVRGTAELALGIDVDHRFLKVPNRPHTAQHQHQEIFIDGQGLPPQAFFAV